MHLCMPVWPAGYSRWVQPLYTLYTASQQAMDLQAEQQQGVPWPHLSHALWFSKATGHLLLLLLLPLVLVPTGALCLRSHPRRLAAACQGPHL